MPYYLNLNKQKTTSCSFSIGPVTLKFTLAVLFCVMSLLFISQTNAASLSGYKIRELEEKRNRQILENQRLNIEMLRLKSLGAIQANNTQGLVPATQIDYLPAKGSIATRD